MDTATWLPVAYWHAAGGDAALYSALTNFGFPMLNGRVFSSWVPYYRHSLALEALIALGHAVTKIILTKKERKKENQKGGLRDERVGLPHLYM